MPGGSDPRGSGGGAGREGLPRPAAAAPARTWVERRLARAGQVNDELVRLVPARQGPRAQQLGPRSCLAAGRAARGVGRAGGVAGEGCALRSAPGRAAQVKVPAVLRPAQQGLHGGWEGVRPGPQPPPTIPAPSMEASACTSGRLGAGPALAPRCQRPSAQAALATARQLRRARRGAQAVVASMGLGFHVGQPAPAGLVAPQEPQLLLPEHDYGLSVKQMQVLGLGNDANGFGSRLPEVKAVSAAAARSCRRCLASLQPARPALRSACSVQPADLHQQQQRSGATPTARRRLRRAALPSHRGGRPGSCR